MTNKRDGQLISCNLSLKNLGQSFSSGNQYQLLSVVKKGGKKHLPLKKPRRAGQTDRPKDQYKGWATYISHLVCSKPLTRFFVWDSASAFSTLLKKGKKSASRYRHRGETDRQADQKVNSKDGQLVSRLLSLKKV